jgi:putative oxidoreductase
MPLGVGPPEALATREGMNDMLPERYCSLIGRVLIASLFITAGLLFLRSPDFAFACTFMSAKGVPYPRVLLIATIVFQLGFGGMILVGWRMRWAAAALLVWIVPATLIFHSFWGLPPSQAPNEMFHFLKNVAVAGGLLLLISTGDGRGRRPGPGP